MKVTKNEFYTALEKFMQTEIRRNDQNSNEKKIATELLGSVVCMVTTTEDNNKNNETIILKKGLFGGKLSILKK